MGLAMEKHVDLDSFMETDSADMGWHISFRLAQGVVAKGVDPRAMLGALATMGACQVIGRDEVSPALAPLGACKCPISWDMVLVGDTTRAAIEEVFVGMPDAMELVIEPMF
jgi:hypothetical protein